MTTRTQAAVAVAERRHASLFLVTGSGLALHLLFPIPLWLTIALSLAAACALVRYASAEGVSIGRWRGSELVTAGAIAGVAAVIAYDSSRFLVSQLGALSVGPFDAFPHFGSALIGADAPGGLRWVVGAGFHITNALGFALAYTFVVRDRSWLWGVAWGLGLEAMMLGIYPRWLQIEQLDEFITMSMVGHVAYGSTLGLTAQRQLARRA